MAAFTDADDSYPILSIGGTDGGGRGKQPPAPIVVSGPGMQAQGTRLDPQFDALVAAMSNGRLVISDSIDGQEPELVVVIDVLNTVEDFRKAVEKVDGLEFLAAIDDDPEEAPEGFTTNARNNKLDHSLFVIAQNQVALRELLSLWGRWKAGDQKFRHGLAQWKTVFATLKDIRPWGPADRIRNANLGDAWAAAMANGEPVRAEIELWYRSTPAARERAERQLVEELTAAGCELLDRSDIEAIAYHAVLVDVPADVAISTIGGSDVLVMNPRVAYVRPQAITAANDDVKSELIAESLGPRASLPDSSTPLVAVLDSIPLLGHQRLVGRLLLDDPHDTDSRFEVKHRDHGTAVSSVVVWGDHQMGAPALGTRVLVYPLLTSTVKESPSMDPDRLAVEVVREALDHLLQGSTDREPSASAVKVVLLAVGHTAQPFGQRISPWARLLDVYAERFGILFVVSAGNYASQIDLGPALVQAGRPEREIVDAARRQVLSVAHDRRILAPADSVNALTVGSLNADLSGNDFPASAIDLLDSSLLPSPTSALGGGYRRAIKPELMAHGGRTLYRQRLDIDDRLVYSAISAGSKLPGVLAASVGSAGVLNAERRFRGTSFAAAIVGHEAGLAAELLIGDGSAPLVPARHVGIATKALLVNSASWEGGDGLVGDVLDARDKGDQKRKASRLLGYGAIRPARIGAGTAERITLIATGLLSGEGSRLVSVPMPKSLNAAPVWRRASISLAWFSPVNARDRRYRNARVWFEVENSSDLNLTLQQADHLTVQRGTIQHEILEGSRPTIVSDQTDLIIRVSCMAGNSVKVGTTPYAVAVTFETAVGSQIPVYTEIAAALRARAAVRGARARVR